MRKIRLYSGYFLAGLLLTSACGEQPSDGTASPAPIVTLTSPTCVSEDDSLKPGLQSLEGSVSGSTGNWAAQFLIEGISSQVVDSELDDEGHAYGNVQLTEQGSYSIRLMVNDGVNEYTSETSNCLVKNVNPSVAFTAPLNASTYNEEQSFVLQVQVSDDDDSAETLEVTFESSLDGILGVATADADGLAQFEATGLSVYNHVITARAQDPWGGADEATLLVEISECLDPDGDGYTQCSMDCDETDPTVHEGAEEVCDGVDNNCNGSIDELGDADGDGVAQCDGDCDDSKVQTYPGATEICDGLDNDCDELSDEDFDGDGDGFATCAECNDADPSAYPGADEICDGVDNNCDGIIDNDLIVIYCRDEDQDGHGDGNVTVSACQDAPPPGYVESCDDCNDAYSSVYADATELCDGLDNNCDGTVDENLESNTFYEDNDIDGFGNGSAPVTSCAPCPTCADNTDDCDDSDDAIYPEAEESCDAVDQDCDSLVDEGVVATLYDDSDGDGYGEDDTAFTGCVPGDLQSQVGGDCDDNNSEINPESQEQCDTVDNDCDGLSDEGVKTTFYLDADGDGVGLEESSLEDCSVPEGYALTFGDCDDSNGGTYPGADEVCNEADSDCDGAVDEAVLNTYYLDTDGDGFGVDNDSSEACTAPEGMAAQSGDCDDNSQTTFPGADELCDGQDNNCDSTIDDGLNSNTFYLDNDADGYGDSNSTMSACSAPSNYVSEASDCNDASDSTFPGATESCNEEDDDCDGQSDEGVQITFYTDADGDGYGSAGDSIEACSQCPDCSSNNDDCDDENALTYPNAPERFDGVDNDCDGTVEQQMSAIGAHVQLLGSNTDNVGSAVTGLGDFNGDGRHDIAVGGPGNASGAGAVYVLLGQTSMDLSYQVSEVDRIYVSDSENSLFGSSLAGADLDGDGFSELLAGAPNYPSVVGNAQGGGRLSVVYGSLSPEDGVITEVESSHYQGTFGDSLIGTSMSAGDINCDDRPDVLIGAPGSWVGLTPNPSGGATYLLPGRNERYDGLGNMSTDDFALLFGDNNDNIGMGVAFAGDMDGDECGDFLSIGGGALGFGPQTTMDMGVVYAEAGTASLIAGAEVDLSLTAETYWSGLESGDYIGHGSNALGDINADGFEDVFVGRQDLQGDLTLSFIFLGGSSWSEAGEATAQADIFVLNDLDSSLSCPCVGSGIGDVNGDGISDFAIAMPETNGGQVFVFFGRNGGLGTQLVPQQDADVIINSVGSSDRLGDSLAPAGDVNGDGFDDFIVGAPGSEGGAGSAYLFLGYGQ